jgi:hypothetical protein
MLDLDRTPEGRFRPGQSGNPAGRPRGSRNKATVILEGSPENAGQSAGDAVAED